MVGYKDKAMKKGTHPDPHHHTMPTQLGDRRDAAELSAEENADLCAGCVKCCTYITVEIDAPRAAWEYDQWIWALFHDRVSLYVETPERWFVHFETTCRHLNSQGRCSIYGRHPVLCRDYDPRSCERRLPLNDIVAWFDDGDELEAWLERHRPVHYRRLMAHRKDMPAGPPVADAHAERRAATAAALITVGELGSRGLGAAARNGSGARGDSTHGGGRRSAPSRRRS